MQSQTTYLPPPPHHCSVHLVAELHLVIKNTGYGPAYDGNISSLPKTTAGLMKLWVAYLRAIPWPHNIMEVGSKDELIDWVKLLKAGHQEATFSREHLCMLHLIATGREISQNQATFVFSKLAHKIVCAWQNWNTDHQNQLCPTFVEVQQTYNKKILPCEQRLHFRGMSWLIPWKCSLCSQGNLQSTEICQCMIQKVFAILENKEKLCLNVFKKEKLSAKISKGRLFWMNSPKTFEDLKERGSCQRN